MVTYKVLCETDFNAEVLINELLANDKIVKAIKSEYAKGLRNISLISTDDSKISIETTKELYGFEIAKDDFADILTLAEEDANNKKLLKKECARVELVDIETV
ncbi:MAG: hypothetical protein ACOX39_00155 [Arcobacteraceae bacterium]